MPEEQKPKIIYDSREARSLVLSGLNGKAELEEKMLEIGDFILSDRVVCERKTTNDFVSSLTDGRLFEQLSNMKSNFQNPLLIIEGNELYSGNVNPKAIRGALAAIAIDFSVPIIFTKSGFDTAEMLVAIAAREQFGSEKELKVRFGKKPRTTKKMQKFLISSLPDIDSVRAENLLKHFKCPEFVFTASEKELKQVPGIGRELAKRIREVIGSDYE